MSQKSNVPMVKTSIYVPREHLACLRAFHKISEIPIAAMMRKGIELAIEHYRKALPPDRLKAKGAAP